MTQQSEIFIYDWLLRQKNMSFGAKYLYTFINANTVDERDYYEASHESLSENLSLDIESTTKAIKELVELSFITVESMADGLSFRYTFVELPKEMYLADIKFGRLSI